MTDMPTDPIQAMQECLDSWINHGLMPSWYTRIMPNTREDHGFVKLLRYVIAEFKEMRAQYEIQNDSYSRLYKQVYGNGL